MPDTHRPRPPRRVIAIDPGDRWIGVALSDDHHRLALPNTTIDRRALPQNTAAAIAQRLREALGQDHAASSSSACRTAVTDRKTHKRPASTASVKKSPPRSDSPWPCRKSATPTPPPCRSPPPHPPALASGRGGRKPGALTPARRNRQRQQRHAGAAATILQRWLDAQLASPPTRPPTDHEVDA